MHPTFLDIRRVLVNLLSNAFKFTDPGFVTVIASCQAFVADPSTSAALPPSRTAVPTISPVAVTSTSRKGRPSSLRVAHSMGVGERRSRGASLVAREAVGGGGFNGRRVRRKARKGEAKGGVAAFLESLEGPAFGNRAVLVVEVKDTGVRMTTEQTDRLFKPFSQVHCMTWRHAWGT